MAGKQTELQLKSWDPFMEKIDNLKGKDINLPDHVDMAAKKRAETKVKRLAKRQAVAKEKKENNEKEAMREVQADREKNLK